MSKEIHSDIIASFTDELESHPVYAVVETTEDRQFWDGVLEAIENRRGRLQRLAG
jgi:hypothetical protein